MLDKGALVLFENLRTRWPRGQPRKLGIKDRGRIQEGKYADLIIFDFKELEPTGSYANPHCFPKGIDYVSINGTVVAREGYQTESLPGMVLRRGRN